MDKSPIHAFKTELKILYAGLIFLILPIPHQVIGFQDKLIFDISMGFALISSPLIFLVPSTILSLLVAIVFSWLISPIIYRWLNSSKSLILGKKVVFITLLVILFFSIFIYPIFLSANVLDFKRMNDAETTGDPQYCFDMKTPLPLISDPLIRQNAVEWKDLCFLKVIGKTHDDSYCKYVERPNSDSWGLNYRILCPTQEILEFCEKALENSADSCKHYCIDNFALNPPPTHSIISQFKFQFIQGSSSCTCLAPDDSLVSSSNEGLDEKRLYCGDSKIIGGQLNE